MQRSYTFRKYKENPALPHPMTHASLKAKSLVALMLEESMQRSYTFRKYKENPALPHPMTHASLKAKSLVALMLEESMQRSYTFRKYKKTVYVHSTDSSSIFFLPSVSHGTFLKALITF